MGVGPGSVAEALDGPAARLSGKRLDLDAGQRHRTSLAVFLDLNRTGHGHFPELGPAISGRWADRDDTQEETGD